MENEEEEEEEDKNNAILNTQSINTLYFFFFCSLFICVFSYSTVLLYKQQTNKHRSV